MWTRRHLFFMGGIFLILVVTVQMLYPYEMALPRAEALGLSMGFQKHNDIAVELETQFENASIELTSGDRTATTGLAKLGAELDSEGMTRQLTDYPLWQRLIPFSLIARAPSLDAFQVNMNGEKMKATAATLATQLSYGATDASFAVADGKLITTKSRAGNVVSLEDVRGALIKNVYTSRKTRVRVPAKTVDPAHADAYIQEAVTQAAATLKRNIVIHVEGKADFKPSSAERAGWLVVTNAETAAHLGVDKEKVKAYVTQVNNAVMIAPTNTVVTLVDGNETARQVGAPGAALDIDTLTDTLASALLDATRAQTIRTTLQPVAPDIAYSRTYTHSQDGLRAYVAYATSTQNVRIVVQQLDGPGWTAAGRSEESIPSASTYKLYVMMRVFDDINSGKLNWDAPMLDTTAGGCFERTIVPSTNPCAEEWIRQYSRSSLNEYVQSRGFSSGTTFTTTDATHTTAGDLAKYLIGLNNGTLVSGNNRSMLLEKMGRQLYRYGIPTGVPNARVEDKFGFLWDYIHDAAIVHKPQGTYVMVIMTKGYSYGYIANVARQIDTILYP